MRHTPSPRLLIALAASAALPAPSLAQEASPPILTGALYLDAWQLEKEFVVSPLALQEWLDLGITAESKLTPERRKGMKSKIGEFLATKCPVTIKDEVVEFTLDRLHFIEPNDKEFVLIDADSVVSARDIRISAVFAAPNTDLKEAVQVFWNLFPADVSYVPVNVADILGTRVFKLTKFAPTINVRGRYEIGAREAPQAPPPPEIRIIEIPWLTILLIVCAIPVIIRLVRSEKTNPRALVLLLVLAGGAAVARKHLVLPLGPFDTADAMEEEESSLILDRLLRGVYHAFDYRDPGKQYDVLSKVVGGEALTPIFLEIQRTLESRQRDGARVRVNNLRVEHSRPGPLDDRLGFEAECSWEVSGRVGHWGHFHDRTNHYRATFVVEPIEETWKITGLTLHSRDRDTDSSP